MNLIQKKKLFILFGLNIIEGVIAFLILSSIPVDPKNTSYMGYSAPRFMVLLIILTGILFFTAMIFFVLKKSKTISNIIRAFQKDNRSIYFLDFIGLICTLFLLLTISYRFMNSELLSIYYIRLLPLFLWGDLICMQGLFILPSVLFDCGLWEGIKLFIAKIRNNKIKSYNKNGLSEKPTPGKYLLPTLFLVAVLIPSSNLMLIKGLPISSIPVYIALILSLPLFFSRRILNSFYRFLSQKLRFYLSIVFVVVILFKFALLFSGVYDGFLACYRTPLRTPANGKCELSYNNPFFRFQATRIDKTINFREDDWALSFINDETFNYYSLEPGNILRNRIPLDVTWFGNGNFIANQELKITYVGTGEIRIGNSIVYLESSYQDPNSRTIVVPQGQVPVEINYHFDDGYRTGQIDQPGPRPMLIIEVGGSEGHFSPLENITPFGFWKIISLLCDAVLIITIILLFLFYLNFLWAERWFIYLMTLAGFINYWYFPDQSLSYIGLSILFLILYYKKYDQNQFILTYFLVVIFGIFGALFKMPNLNHLFYQSAGQDMLTYESLARNILETRSLQGGEPIFFVQAFYRYILYATHMFFGDGESLTIASKLAILNLACFSAVYKVLNGKKLIGKYQKTVALLAAIILIIFLNSHLNESMVIKGISEYPTWVFLLFSFYFFNSEHTSKNWILTAILLALSFITRTNQLPGILIFILIFFIRVWKRKKSVALIGLALFIGIGSLLAWHNYFYGGQFVLLPISGKAEINNVLPPTKLINQFNNPETQSILWQQVRLLIGVSPDAQWMTTLTMQMILLLWLTAVIWGMISIKRNRLINLLFLTLPLFYMGVHIFYAANSYYPRHLTVSYIALTMVAIQFIIISKDQLSDHIGGINIADY